MSLQPPPCKRPDADPDDWFIRSDGRQYSDVPLVTNDELDEHLRSIDVDADMTEEQLQRAANRFEADALRLSLQRRRHAKEACHSECHFRELCLSAAVEGSEPWGTWGGYYEEELRDIYSRRSRRRSVG